MREIPANVKLLLEIEDRQDEVLRDLAALDERIERVLAECAAFCQSHDCPTVPLGTPRPASAAGPLAPSNSAAQSVPAVKVA